MEEESVLRIHGRDVRNLYFRIVEDLLVLVRFGIKALYRHGTEQPVVTAAVKRPFRSVRLVPFRLRISLFKTRITEHDLHLPEFSAGTVRLNLRRPCLRHYFRQPFQKPFIRDHDSVHRFRPLIYKVVVRQTALPGTQRLLPLGLHLAVELLEVHVSGTFNRSYIIAVTDRLQLIPVVGEERPYVPFHIRLDIHRTVRIILHKTFFKTHVLRQGDIYLPRIKHHDVIVVRKLIFRKPRPSKACEVLTLKYSRIPFKSIFVSFCHIHISPQTTCLFGTPSPSSLYRLPWKIPDDGAGIEPDAIRWRLPWYLQYITHRVVFRPSGKGPL